MKFFFLILCNKFAFTTTNRPLDRMPCFLMPQILRKFRWWKLVMNYYVLLSD